MIIVCSTALLPQIAKETIQQNIIFFVDNSGVKIEVWSRIVKNSWHSLYLKITTVMAALKPVRLPNNSIRVQPVTPRWSKCWTLNSRTEIAPVAPQENLPMLRAEVTSFPSVPIVHSNRLLSRHPTRSASHNIFISVNAKALRIRITLIRPPLT